MADEALAKRFDETVLPLMYEHKKFHLTLDAIEVLSLHGAVIRDLHD